MTLLKWLVAATTAVKIACEDACMQPIPDGLIADFG